MATKTLVDFLPEVLPFVDGCPDLIAKNAVRNAAIELCALGRIWRYDLDPISIAADVPEYDLNYPSSTYVADILRAVLDGTPIYGKTREDLDAEVPGWEGDRATPEKGDAIGYVLSSDKRKIRIVRCPDKTIANGLIVEAALKPSRAVTTLEEFIFEEHLETIAQGAKAKLFEMEGMSWANATAGQSCRKKFLDACAAASVKSAQSHGRTALRTKPVYSLLR